MSTDPIATKPDEVVDLIKGATVGLVETRLEAAKTVLDAAQKGKKGFRAPSKKEIQAAQETLKEDRRIRADFFVQIYDVLKEVTGIEVGLLGFNMAAPNLYQADIGLKGYTPPKPPETKPWSEAKEENLATRINCEHKLAEDGTACEKCGLNPENWGADNKGVSPEYEKAERGRIDKVKHDEKNCEQGKHVLNDEAKADPEKAPMAFCVKCRKGYKDFTDEEKEYVKQAISNKE